MILKRGLMLVALLALTALPARANTLTFTFLSDHCSEGDGCIPDTPGANGGTITVSAQNTEESVVVRVTDDRQ